MYIARASSAEEGTLYEVPRDARVVATATGLALLHAWIALNDGYEIVEASKDVPADVAIAPHHLAWYDTSTSSVVYELPDDTSAAAQRSEIYNLLLTELRSLDVARLSAKDGAIATASLFVRMVGAYASVNSTNAILDSLKAQAQVDLNEAAWAMNTASTGTASWLVSLASPGLVLYVKPETITRGGLAVPSASTPAGLVHPTQAQLDAFDVQRSIG